MSPRSIGASAAGKWIGGAAVIVLALVSVVLTLLALQHVDSPPIDAVRTPAPSFTELTPAIPEPSSTPSPSPTPRPTPVFDRGEERFLAVGSGAIWRGTAGECGVTAPTLERSTDGGKNWNDVTPTYLGIGRLLTVRAFAGDQGEVVAQMGDDCETQALRTFTYGRFWEAYDDVLANSWYVDPVDAGTLDYPDGKLPSPCPTAHGLQVTNDLRALVCDGSAYALSADETWQALPATDVVALTISGNDVIVAHSTDSCDGTALTRYADVTSDQTSELGCIADVDAATPITIALSGTDALLWAGENWVVTPLASQP